MDTSPNTTAPSPAANAAEGFPHTSREDRRHTDPLRQFKSTLRMCKRRADRHGVPFSITLQDLLPLPTVCPVLGLPLKHGTNGGSDSSPSIDRIIPAKGYVLGNVSVISLKANRIKNDATPEELMAVAKFYARG